MKLSVVMVLLGVSEALSFGAIKAVMEAKKVLLKRLGETANLKEGGPSSALEKLRNTVRSPEGTNDVLAWTDKNHFDSNDWRFKAGEELAREGKQGEELGMYLFRLEGISPDDKWYEDTAEYDLSDLPNGPLSDYLLVFDSLVRGSTWLEPNTEDYNGALLDVLSMGSEQFETELNYARGGGGDGEY